MLRRAIRGKLEYIFQGEAERTVRALIQRGYLDEAGRVTEKGIAAERRDGPHKAGRHGTE
jgi:hypothetical protein